MPETNSDLVSSTLRLTWGFCTGLLLAPVVGGRAAGLPRLQRGHWASLPVPVVGWLGDPGLFSPPAASPGLLRGRWMQLQDRRLNLAQCRRKS